MDVQQLMVAVVACFELDLGELRLGVVQQQVVDLLRADLCGGGVGPDVDARRLVAPTAKEGNGFEEDAGRMGADAPFLNLRTFDGGEREEAAAHVVEHLDGVAVDRVDLVAQAQHRIDWVRVALRCVVGERQRGERVEDVGDEQELPVRRHPVALDPAGVNDPAECGVARQGAGCRVPVPQRVVRHDAKQVEAVVHHDELVVCTTDIPEHRDDVVRGDADELAAHHPVVDAVPVDPAAIRTRAGDRLDEAIPGPQERVPRTAVDRRRHHVHRVRHPEVGAVVGVDAGDDGDGCHVSSSRLSATC